MRERCAKQRGKGFYNTSVLKSRKRRTKAQMDNVLDWTKWVLNDEGEQMTISHLFYRLVGHDVIPKNEVEYLRLAHDLAKWRRRGLVAWNAFTDSTRWHIVDESFDSVRDALADTVSTYRRNLWRTQPCYLEIWCEKDACAQILAKKARPFGVPVFIARGFASLTSLYEAAAVFRRANEHGKRSIIYQFGDHDPSGVMAGKKIADSLRNDFHVAVEVVRVAVTEQQIKDLNLPTRPTKESSHSKGWEGNSVELDSMPIAEIHRIVESCITRHIDQRAWESTKLIEKAERETLETFAETFQKGAL